MVLFATAIFLSAYIIFNLFTEFACFDLALAKLSRRVTVGLDGFVGSFSWKKKENNLISTAASN